MQALILHFSSFIQSTNNNHVLRYTSILWYKVRINIVICTDMILLALPIAISIAPSEDFSKNLPSGKSWQAFNSRRSLLSRNCQVLCWLGLEIISCHCFIGRYTRPGFYIPIICQYNKTRRLVPDRGINMSAWKRSGRQELAIPPINGVVLRLLARDAGEKKDVKSWYD